MYTQISKMVNAYNKILIDKSINQKTDKIIRGIFYFLVTVGVMLCFRKNFMYALDDSYITFRYAQNLSEGHGLCFNIDEKYFGSTAMGFAIILGAISHIIEGLTHGGILVKDQIANSGVLIPVLANLISAISIGAIAVVLFKISDSMLGLRIGFVAAIFFCIFIFISPVLDKLSGHETASYLAILFVSLYLLFTANKYFLSGLLFGLSVTLRPDSILMFLIVFFILCARCLFGQQKRQTSISIIVFVGGFLLLMIPWIIFCDVYFGQILPGTLKAKKAQVLLGYWPLYSANIVFKHTIFFFGGYLLSVFIILILSAIILLISTYSIATLLRNPHSCMIISILFFGIGQFIFYILIKVTFWAWYVNPLWFVLTIGSAISALTLLNFLFASQSKHWVRILAASTLLLVFALSVLSFGRIEYWFNEWISDQRNIWKHSYSYDSIALYLREKEPAGTTVATAEPGALGFKLGPAFKVVDELGLVSPGVAQKIIEGDFEYPFVTWNPEYAIVSWDGKYTSHHTDWFKERYCLVGEFDYQLFWKNQINRGAYLFKRCDQSHQNTR